MTNAGFHKEYKTSKTKNAITYDMTYNTIMKNWSQVNEVSVYHKVSLWSHLQSCHRAEQSFTTEARGCPYSARNGSHFADHSFQTIVWLPNSRVCYNKKVACHIINQSINQYIYNAPWYRGMCYSVDYAETKRNVLSRILNVLTDGAAVSKLCGGTDRNFCVDDRSERDWLYGLIRSAR